MKKTRHDVGPDIFHLRPLSKAERRDAEVVAAVVAFRAARRTARIKRLPFIDLPPRQAELIKPLLVRPRRSLRESTEDGSRYSPAVLRAVRANSVNARGETRR